MVNRKTFSRLLAEHYNITYKSSEIMCKQVFEFLGELLYEEKEDVKISGFGTFKHKQSKETRTKHPTTGEMIRKPARDYVKFVPSEVIDNRE